MKKIKAGVIGYGGAFNMGQQHLRQLQALKTFTAEAVCDVDPARLEAARKDFPKAGTFLDTAEMLRRSDVELVVVVLPHNLHAPVALQCLKAGRHVVVEKPFAVTVKECDAMISAAKRRKLMVSAYHNRHWDGYIRTMVKNAGRIGRPYRWESFHGGYYPPRQWWRSEKEASGGIIYDWGAHLMEWMLQLMPYAMKEISGYQVNEVWPCGNEDELEAVVRFKEDAVASHLASHIAAAGRDWVKILGTKGAMAVRDKKVLLFGRSAKGKEFVRTLKTMPSTGHLYYRNIRDHLVHGEPLVISPEWARRVIQILDYAGQSAAKGKALKAKYE